MATTVDADDLAYRTRIVGLRRDLSVRLAEFNETVEAALAVGGDDGLTNDYRRELSVFRHALGVHHTRWPAIVIADDRAAYLASAQALRRKREHFVAWVRDRLLPAQGAR